MRNTLILANILMFGNTLPLENKLHWKRHIASSDEKTSPIQLILYHTILVKRILERTADMCKPLNATQDCLMPATILLFDDLHLNW
jgi:hypothetical protein